MPTEFIAIYDEILSADVATQIEALCTCQPSTPTNPSTIDRMVHVYDEIYDRRKGTHTYWFTDPGTITMLRLFDRIPSYIGRFDTSQLSIFDSFYDSFERYGLLMCSAGNLQDELDNYRDDLVQIYRSATPYFPNNIENDIVDLLNASYSVIENHVRTYFEAHRV